MQTVATLSNASTNLISQSITKPIDTMLAQIQSVVRRLQELGHSTFLPPHPATPPLEISRSTPASQMVIPTLPKPSHLNDLFEVADVNTAWQENIRWFSQSCARDRSMISTAQINDFLNPNVPMDRLFSRDKFLGNGWFGRVSLWHTEVGESIAIKELLDRQHFQPGAPGLHDFQVGLTLDHPNVVKVHHLVNKVDEIGKIRRYLIMEYVDGKNINPRVTPFAARMALLEEMLESTLHILQRGVLPRDLHFGNIMKTADGHWKWVDLGLYIPNLEEAAHRTIESTLSELNYVATSLAQGPTTYYSPLSEALETASKRFAELPIAKGAATPEAVAALRRHVGTLMSLVREHQTTGLVAAAAA